MDIAQLKMVLDVVQATTGTAVWLVGAWLVTAYVLPWVVGIALVYTVVALLIRATSAGTDTPDMRALRDRLHVGCGGYVTQGEFQAAIRRALRAVEERDELRDRVRKLEEELRNAKSG